VASFTIKKTIAAPPETVFAVLTDYVSYSDFTPIRKVEIEKEGVPAPNGVGTIRVLSMIGPPLREEIVEFEPPSKFVYRLLSGAPLKDHVGTVTLAADGAGTLMVYTVDTTPTVPVGGGIVVAIVKRSVGQLASGVAKEAERRTG
jgi:uncharacterized protein YndB with AHSA1/START domain